MLLLGAPACKQRAPEPPASSPKAADAAAPRKEPAPEVKTPPSSRPAAAVAPAPNALQMIEAGADEGVYGSEFPDDVDIARRLPVRASSVLCEKSGSCHAPAYIMDDKDKTAWCEGAAGPGIGATLTIDLRGPKLLYGIRFLNAYAKSKRAMFDNARLRKVAIIVDDGRRFGAELGDQSPKYAFDPGMQGLYNYPTVTFPAPIRTRNVILEVLSVYPGRKYEDLCISEIDFFVGK
jgi:hypothetical protein